MDGSHDTVVGRDGLEPQWINEHTVAIVTNDHQQIVTIDMAHQNAEAALFSVTDGVDLGGPSDIDSFAWHEPSQTLVVSLFRRDWQTNVSDAYALVVVDARGARTLAGPSDTPWVQPAFHPDGGRLLVATIKEIQLMDVASGTAKIISPAQWYGVTPSWSPDGNEVLWLANGVGGPIGPAVLIRQPYANQQVQGQPTLVVGNHQESLHQFPAYPAWT